MIKYVGKKFSMNHANARKETTSSLFLGSGQFFNASALLGATWHFPLPASKPKVGTVAWTNFALPNLNWTFLLSAVIRKSSR